MRARCLRLRFPSIPYRLVLYRGTGFDSLDAMAAVDCYEYARTVDCVWSGQAGPCSPSGRGRVCTAAGNFQCLVGQCQVFGRNGRHQGAEVVCVAPVLGDKDAYHFGFVYLLPRFRWNPRPRPVRMTTPLLHGADKGPYVGERGRTARSVRLRLSLCGSLSGEGIEP